MHARIGEIAGFVWDFLEEEKEASVTAITNALDVPSTKVYMAVGWLAREGKIEFEEAGRGKRVRLK